MRSVRELLWLFSGVCGVCSALFMVVGLSKATGPVEYAAVGALGSAWAVVPYVVARAWDEVTKR